MSMVRETATGRTLAIDHDRCSGTGYCQEHFPAVFTLIGSRAHIRDDVDITMLTPETLEEAEAICPWFAISVSDQPT
jgi:ferredoxin